MPAMVKVSVLDTVPLLMAPLIVAPRVTLKLPVTVGVPVNLPVLESMLMPAGNPPAVKLLALTSFEVIWYRGCPGYTWLP